MFVSVNDLKAEVIQNYKIHYGSFGWSLEIEESRSKKTLASAKRINSLFQIKVSRILVEKDFRLAVVTIVILIARINRKKIPEFLNKEYNLLRESYFAANSEMFVSKTRSGTHKGSYFDLQKIFDDVINKQGLIFANGTKIQWSQKLSVRRVGYFVEKDDTIVISKILDHPLVPAEVVEFIVFHEVLHKLLGTENRTSNRIVHGKKFNTLEKTFYKFAEANYWLNKIYPNFVRKVTKRPIVKKYI